jgi:hypothetical protein
MQWLDKKPWISYPQHRWFIKTLPYFYLYTPFSSNEDDIRRTLKIAHFIAISGISEKSLDKTLIDLHEAQKIIEEFIELKGKRIDDDAISELILERLIILNRMNAIFMQSNKQPPTDLESARQAARDVLSSVEDIETKHVLVKELYLYDFVLQEAKLKEAAHPDRFSDFVDAYHFGLARCAARDDSGANLIEVALQNIPKSRLIEITLRNVDHPLIAAAGLSAQSSCTNAIDSINKKIRG